VYEPNPRAIVVAIDAGHGGCLDWGVPDPSRRGVELAEKAMTLGIAQRLRDLLEADGIGVVMIREDDEALAGDFYPELGCEARPGATSTVTETPASRSPVASGPVTSSRPGLTSPTSPAPMRS
jgi:hypothetical protein